MSGDAYIAAGSERAAIGPKWLPRPRMLISYRFTMLIRQSISILTTPGLISLCTSITHFGGHRTRFVPCREESRPCLSVPAVTLRRSPAVTRHSVRQGWVLGQHWPECQNRRSGADRA
jgi:hypothetical protein